MRQTGRRLLAAVLTGLVLLLAGCALRDGRMASLTDLDDPVVRLWISEDSPLCSGLSELVEKYNALEPQANVRVVCFRDEEALAAALKGETGLNWETPELLVVSGQYMRELKMQGALGALSLSPGSAPRFLSAFRDLDERIGSGYFPLGMEMPVLVSLRENRELLADCGSLESLCRLGSGQAAKQGAAFFSADSFAEVFADCMAQKGSAFYTGLAVNADDPVYREVYNLLADTAFDGAMELSKETVLPRVLRRELVCGICSCRALRDVDTRRLCLFPVPPMDGCEPMVGAQIWGIAVLPPGENDEQTMRFISWLCSFDHTVNAVLEAGLVPAGAGDWAKDRDEVTKELRAAAETYSLFIPAASAKESVREEFEQSFRSALALLG